MLATQVLFVSPDALKSFHLTALSSKTLDILFVPPLIPDTSLHSLVSVSLVYYE
jgi:hypothetical protein